MKTSIAVIVVRRLNQPAENEVTGRKISFQNRRGKLLLDGQRKKLNEPLISLKPFLAEYGWALAMGYHIVFMVMFTRLMFTKK